MSPYVAGLGAAYIIKGLNHLLSNGFGSIKLLRGQRRYCKISNQDLNKISYSLSLRVLKHKVYMARSVLGGAAKAAGLVTDHDAGGEFGAVRGLEKKHILRCTKSKWCF